ncbi:hypothetical protein K435DRAFT_807225 [Dendrothele bispora CBS 962.96]|uniref:Uncharacterized protein n=1 Tax=Dendrothele bispora (strain CBS 962.96) TaxID=1314807 RepID=A0A4S8L5E3_DENBC|nr:hypothetical protein K435DRAFT_807225 [Dendrothele bispora CBS 962.96]
MKHFKFIYIVSFMKLSMIGDVLLYTGYKLGLGTLDLLYLVHECYYLPTVYLFACRAVSSNAQQKLRPTRTNHTTASVTSSGSRHHVGNSAPTPVVQETMKLLVERKIPGVFTHLDIITKGVSCHLCHCGISDFDYTFFDSTYAFGTEKKSFNKSEALIESQMLREAGATLFAQDQLGPCRNPWGTMSLIPEPNGVSGWYGENMWLAGGFKG